jgi:hypothetical protein
MKTSESTKNLNLAMFKFQGIMPRIKRNAKNSHFKSTYITWDELAGAVIPYLQECGLYFEQEEGEVDGYVTVSTRITHVESGEYKQYAPYRIKEATGGNQDHNAGKSTTYAQKRSLVLALGLRGTDEDTDGNDIDPPTRKQTSYTKDSSPRYESRREAPPLPDAWSQLAQENGVSGTELEETSMPLKHDSLDIDKERCRFFAIATEKGLTDKRMKALAYYHFKKTSRSQLTASEFRALSDMLGREKEFTILEMIRMAKEMREAV